MTYVILSQHELTTRQALHLPTGDARISHARAGMTLIELLIVIVILTTLVAAAIPILSPSSNDRRIREASRAVNTYITAAQTKAMELRRPVGVALKKLSADTGNADDNGVCLELYQVEQPPAFTGFDETSAVRISFSTTPYQVRMQFVRRDQTTTGTNLSTGWFPDSIPEKMLQPGDRIEVAGNVYRFLAPATNPNLYPSEKPAELDTQGRFYNQDVGNSNETLIFFAQVENDAGQMLNCEVDREGYLVKPQLHAANGFPQLTLIRYGGNTHVAGQPPFWTTPTSYKILRQPSPTSAEPYQLPEGIAIDLRASGDSRDVYHNAEHQQPVDRNNNQSPVMILFTPEGSVHRVVLNVGPGLSDLSGFADKIISDPIVSSIFLLIGPRENIPVTQLTSDNTLKTVGSNQLTDTELEELKTSINWLNPESRWVVIGAQSGRVVSTENAFVDPRSVLTVATTGTPPISETSQQLRNLQINAAREFAREMTQAGDL
jgi:prepilin-type N-terminal cleavage/methylation domain-containing protein